MRPRPLDSLKLRLARKWTREEGGAVNAGRCVRYSTGVASAWTMLARAALLFLKVCASHIVLMAMYPTIAPLTSHLDLHAAACKLLYVHELILMCFDSRRSDDSLAGGNAVASQAAKVAASRCG